MVSPPVPVCLHREAGSDFSTPSIGDSRTEALSHSCCSSQGSSASLEALQALSHAHPWLWRGQLASPSKELARCAPTGTAPCDRLCPRGRWAQGALGARAG